MKIAIFCLYIFTSLICKAGPGATGGVGNQSVYLTCAGQKNNSFIISATPVPTFKKGTLHLETGEILHLLCQRDNSNWICIDRSKQENGLQIVVENDPNGTPHLKLTPAESHSLYLYTIINNLDCQWVEN